MVQEKTFQKAEVKKVVETKPEHFVVPNTKPAFTIFEDVIPEPTHKPVGVRVEDDDFKENIELECGKTSHEVEKHEQMTTYSGKFNITAISKYKFVPKLL